MVLRRIPLGSIESLLAPVLVPLAGFAALRFRLAGRPPAGSPGSASPSVASPPSLVLALLLFSLLSIYSKAELSSRSFNGTMVFCNLSPFGGAPTFDMIQTVLSSVKLKLKLKR